MGKVITYYLGDEKNSAEEYYDVIKRFSKEIIGYVKENVGVFVENRMEYQNRIDPKKLKKKEEYYLEILILGVLWNEYINNAIKSRLLSKTILTRTVYFRVKGKKMKKVRIKIKGFLSTIISKNNKSLRKDVARSFNNVNKLIQWLKATGEFIYEVKCLQEWSNYLKTKNKEEIYQFLTRSINIANEFEEKSKITLGVYTKGVGSFLREVYPSHTWKEDVIYCGKREVQYHLNMVGAEILNRIYREDFLKTDEKRILLPGCMRNNLEEECRGIRTEYGYVCINCKSDCAVSKLSLMGKKYGVKVFVIPHESLIYENTNIEDKSIGIIGVVCVLNLISGGMKAKSIGFIPQCVILNYCGCKNHWDEEGIITNLDINKLFNVLAISDTSADINIK
ncbi:DUF116 domain-containing protein [Clostridium paridis]|uniref:DUF116 domain-containing protein n=1 Tax=Clostridium paridis TaxID=2803863 RepID=A0A937FDJ2_9CLOT|nr:DUF116 domain-containing protein [Clostridium paridis]MBL4931264.1 DUF116 domain-containing protein [Clostridium paridis]